MRWHCFPLHPEIPDEGIALADLFHIDASQVERMVAELQEKADQLGLPFGPRTTTYNSRLAQELGLWATERGRGHAFHLAAFAAYFAKGKNLARQSVLIELAEHVGLPADEAETVLTSRSWRQRVDQDWQLAQQLHVTAVPTFILADSVLVGAQSSTTLAHLMLQHGIARRTQS